MFAGYIMKKILVVDDQKNVRIALSIGLGRVGYAVDVASNAKSALLKLKNDSFDAILADVRMPDINGFVLATVVKELYPQMKIILMSAYDFKDFEGKFESLDQCPKLSKPFEMVQLLSLLGNGEREKSHLGYQAWKINSFPNPIWVWGFEWRFNRIGQLKKDQIEEKQKLYFE